MAPRSFVFRARHVFGRGGVPSAFTFYRGATYIQGGMRRSPYPGGRGTPLATQWHIASSVRTQPLPLLTLLTSV